MRATPVVDAPFRRAADADAFAAASHAPAAADWVVCEAPVDVFAGHRGPFLAPAPPLARLDTTRASAALLTDPAGTLDGRLQPAAP